MEKANASGVLLRNQAVPSIFPETSASNVSVISNITLAIECGTTTIKSIITPAEFATTSEIKSSIIPAIECDTSAMECDTIPAKNMPAIVWKSILKSNKNKTTDLASISPPRTQSASPINLTIRKPNKIMDSSIIHLKKQEMSPQEKRMWRTIKTLRQKLRRKEEKINSLQRIIRKE